MLVSYFEHLNIEQQIAAMLQIVLSLCRLSPSCDKPEAHELVCNIVVTGIG